jgi:PAS domain-containing protein
MPIKNSGVQPPFEDSFLAIVEQSPFSIQILSPDGKTIRVNKAWEQLWGIRLEQIEGYNILEDEQLVENGIMPYIERAFAGQFAEIPPVLYDPEESIPGITSNAQPKRWTKGVIYPIKNLIGEIQQIVLVHEDITNQILAEEKIKTSEARYRSLLENANDIIYSHDLQGKYLSINSAGEKITGYSQKEILSGMNITQIIVPEHLGLAKKMTERKLSDPDLPTVYEIDIFTKKVVA